MNPIKRGNEILVNQATEGDQTLTWESAYTKAIGSIPDGHFMVVWEDRGVNPITVKGQIFDSTGTKVSNEDILIHSSSYSQNDATVIGLSNNNFFVAWDGDNLLGDNSGRAVVGRIFDTKGTPVTPVFRINQKIPGSYQPAITELSNGNLAIAWQGPDEYVTGIFARIFTNTGIAVTDEFQVSNNRNSDNGLIANQYGAAISSIDDRQFVVAWQSWEQDGSSYGVYAKIYTNNGLPVTNEFLVNHLISGSQGQPDIANLGNKQFLVTYSSQYIEGNISFGVAGRRFYHNGTVAEPFPEKHASEFFINDNIVDNQYVPHIASFTNGNVIVCWHDPANEKDLNSTSVFAKILDSSAKKIGNEFMLNTFISRTQSAPSVTTFKNNAFAAVWFSNGQSGGKDFDIYAQLFYPILHIINDNTQSIPYYTNNGSVDLRRIYINSAAEPTVNTTLTVSDIAAGSFGEVFVNTHPGMWQANNHTIADINLLLGNLKFIPQDNFHKNFTITYNITDGINSPVVGNIEMIGLNRAPMILNKFQPPIVAVGQRSLIEIPDNIFGDRDGDPLTLTATGLNHDSLPGWINFDPKINKFTVQPDSVSDTALMLTARDPSGAEISTNFRLSAQKTPTSFMGKIFNDLVDLAISEKGITVIYGAIATIAIGASEVIRRRYFSRQATVIEPVADIRENAPIEGQNNVEGPANRFR